MNNGFQSRCWAGLAIAGSIFLVGGAAAQSDRDVQIASVDFEAQVIELKNFGDLAVSLSGWHFCTHNDQASRRYTTGGGGLGVVGTLNTGQSAFIHLSGDADEAGEFNASAVGSILALDTGPYSINVFSSAFFNGLSNMVDHVQWAIGGSSNNARASSRNSQAVSAGIWDDAGVWVDTTGAVRIDLVTPSPVAGNGSAVTSASDFLVSGPPIAGDVNADGSVDQLDFGTLAFNFEPSVGHKTQTQGDLNGDGIVGKADFGILAFNFGNTSPGIAPGISPGIAPGGFVASRAVPEPGSLGVLLLVGVFFARRRGQDR